MNTRQASKLATFHFVHFRVFNTKNNCSAIAITRRFGPHKLAAAVAVEYPTLSGSLPLHLRSVCITLHHDSFLKPSEQPVVESN